MKRITLIFICLTLAIGLKAQLFSPTGAGWKYTPKIQADSAQVRAFFKLNGEEFKITEATDDQILQRKLIGGKHIWVNVDAAFPEVSAEKEYVVLVSQTGTGNPSVITLKNTIGTIVVTRIATGTYQFTLVGAFTEDKTTPVDDIMMDQVGNLFTLNRISADVMELKTYAAANISAAADGILTKRYINITVYP